MRSEPIALGSHTLRPQRTVQTRVSVLWTEYQGQPSALLASLTTLLAETLCTGHLWVEKKARKRKARRREAGEGRRAQPPQAGGPTPGWGEGAGRCVFCSRFPRPGPRPPPPAGAGAGYIVPNLRNGFCCPPSVTRFDRTSGGTWETVPAAKILQGTRQLRLREPRRQRQEAFRTEFLHPWVGGFGTPLLECEGASGSR